MQIQLLEEIEIPMMKFFNGLSQEQLFELTKISSTQFFGLLSRNQAMQQIKNAMDQWMTNQLPVIQKHEVCAEDITMVTYLRKKALLHFIPDYSNDITQMMELVKEIDFFLATSETIATNAYINLLKNNISDNTHLIEKVNYTIPGAVYVFDTAKFKGVYSNNKLADIIGYSQEELNALGENVTWDLIHPDDQQAMQNHMEELKRVKDGQIIVFKYRVKDKNGNYHWLS